MASRLIYTTKIVEVPPLPKRARLITVFKILDGRSGKIDESFGHAEFFGDSSCVLPRCLVSETRGDTTTAWFTIPGYNSVMVRLKWYCIVVFNRQPTDNIYTHKPRRVFAC